MNREEAYVDVKPFAWAKVRDTISYLFIFIWVCQNLLLFYEEMVRVDQVQQRRNVAIMIFDGVEVLDFCGPLEVFSMASDNVYFNVYTVAEKEMPIQAINNLNVNPSYSIDNCPFPDILLVPGGRGTRSEMNNEILIAWINRIHEQAELVLSVCTGALLLAKAGLLEGLQITTHHFAFEELRDVAPSSSKILEGVRYVDNGKVILSAGVSAGIDMSLYVVSRLLGEERALETARRMEYEWKQA